VADWEVVRGLVVGHVPPPPPPPTFCAAADSSCVLGAPASDLHLASTQELFNAEMPLSDRTAKLEAVFQQHWNTKRKEEAEMEAKEKPNNKGGTTATDTSKVAWPVSRLFLSAPAVVSRKPKEDEPFPGIPLHRESKSVQASLRPEEGIASSSEEQKTERAEASEPSVSEQETTVRQSDQTVRPTEVEENYGRGLSSLEKAIASSGQSEVPCLSTRTFVNYH